MQLNLVDDYQANNKPTQTISAPVNNAITFVLADEYLANNYEASNLYLQYDPSQYENIAFIVSIQDDFAKANDEYVLITEDGIVLTLEDYYNQDEIAIVVR